MKWAIAVILVLAGVAATTAKEPDKIALEITETTNHRQGRYGKGDIPLLLIRPAENNKKHQHRSNSRPMMTVAMTKSEDPAGAYSETSYILKTNDDSLTFTELLPKLGLSTNLFGLPSVASGGSSSSSGGGQQRPKQNSASQSSSSSHHGSSSSSLGSSGPVYKVALPSESPYKTTYSSSNLHGPLIGLNHVSKVSSKPQIQYTTTVNGDDSHTIVGYSPLTSSAGKTSFYSSNLKPLSTISHGYKHLPSYQESSLHSGFPTSHSSSHLGQSPPGVIEEIVVGKPLGNIRPSIPEGIHSQSEYSHDGHLTTYEHQYPTEIESHNEASLVSPSSASSGEDDSIHSLKSDHKFAHITTNYYIPHTINSNSEDRNNEGTYSPKKPFTPSPQIDFFQPEDVSHDSHNGNQFRNHYAPSDEAIQHQQEQEQERIEYQTESSKTEDYFLPKVHSTYHHSGGGAPSHSLGSQSLGPQKVVYQQNPSFTSYFKFGTNVEEAKKADPRPHTFPRTESKLSYGQQFKPNPDTSFSAHPTPLEQKPAESRPSHEHKTIQYTIKQEAIDYDPYKFAPIALLKPTHAPPSNHDVTNYEQVHKDYVTKYQGGGQQKPNYFHREFATKFEAENYVKNAILGASQASSPAENRPQPHFSVGGGGGSFKYEHQPTPIPEIQTEYEYVTELNYPEGYGQPSHGHQEQETRYVFDTPPSVEHVKPVIEHPSSDPQYHLEQPFQFPSDVPSYDPSHLDLGQVGHDDGSYVEPSRATILRPSMELKETIASKSKSSSISDTAATNPQSPHLANNNDDVEQDAQQPHVNDRSEPNNQPPAQSNQWDRNANNNSFDDNRINTSNNPQSNLFGGSPTHRPKHPPHHHQPTPHPQPSSKLTSTANLQKPILRRRPTTSPNKKNNNSNNNNSLTAHSKSQAKDQSNETLSEKSSNAEGGEKRRRLNPRQKVISCERQCIRNSSTVQEYDPVCGNDGKTYSNKGKLSCTKQCGKTELDVANIGSCALTHK